MARCMFCRTSLLKCGCWSAGSGTTKRAPKGSGRKNNTVRNGVEWCGTCSCRVLDGRCMNSQCSTNKK